MRYGASIVKWAKSELDETDRKTRKIMTLNKTLHPRSDVDWLYVIRMEGGRGLIGCVCKQKKTALNGVSNVTLNL